ncbi:acyltransferase family protein [Arthrobacter sp. Leaf234]|uniref:acyltransferase family protein n=1 Tax=Arthrobacter sp. Leaf234 TaxID=1736303 RepID=UPI000B1577FD|nr:acyltransferase [Arthrobacter sp. Leaf234]
MTTSDNSIPTVRLPWADATRGAGVIAVVVFHVLIWVHDPVFGTETAAGPVLSRVNALLGTLRMPVLFALAGILASPSLIRGGDARKALSRSVSSYYLYVVWLLIYLLLFLLVGTPGSPHYFDSLNGFLTQLVVPDTTLWFIFALAVYIPVVLAARAIRLPPPVLLVLAVVVWFVLQSEGDGSLLERCAEHFVFFASGVFGAAALRRAAAAPLWLAGLFSAVFLALMALRTTDIGAQNEALEFMSSLASIPAMAAVAHQVCRIAPVARAAGFIGARTLPVYVLHPVVIVCILAFGRQEALGPFVDSFVVDALYPLVLSAVIIVVCLTAENLLARIPGNPLFALPESVRRRILGPRRQDTTATRRRGRAPLDAGAGAAGG